jgi:hypothetical protein
MGWVSVSGGVEAVDEAGGTITLWLVGFTGLHTMRLAEEMPDWMREAGAVFVGEISEENYLAQDLGGRRGRTSSGSRLRI